MIRGKTDKNGDWHRKTDYIIIINKKKLSRIIFVRNMFKDWLIVKCILSHSRDTRVI